MSVIIGEQLRQTITNYMYLGLLPFFAGAIGPWVAPTYSTPLIQYFLFYSSLILVFLAGAMWAIGLFSQMEQRTPIVHGAIIFSLWPLGAYWLSPFFAALLLLFGFLALLFWEKCYCQQVYPEWYQKLRHKITFIVVACHMLTTWNVIYPLSL